MARKKNGVNKSRFFVLAVIVLFVMSLGNLAWSLLLSSETRGLWTTVTEGMEGDLYNQWYRSVPVSSDANWYFVPEVRIRFPYVNVAVAWQDFSYKMSYFSDGTTADEGGVTIEEEFEMDLAVDYFSGYGTQGNRADGASVKSISELECTSPFVLTDHAERMENNRNHREVYSGTLGDGRDISIWQATNKSCADFVESEQGEKLLESLKRVQSF